MNAPESARDESAGAGNDGNRTQGNCKPCMGATLEHALCYVLFGWRVFPLLPKSKKPATKDWPSQATVDRTTLTNWFNSGQHNIAVACGCGSGIFVLDVDPRHGGDAAFEKLIEDYGSLPDTAMQLTGGGGTQYFFKYPQGEIRNSAGRLGPGLDIRGEGGYVVLPPSIHPDTGAAYEWEASSDPLEGCPVAEPPRWLIRLLTNGMGTKQAENKPPEAIPEGRRNSHLVSLAGSMRRRGMSQPAIEAALLAENACRCDPPLSEEEVGGIAASVSRYEPRPRGEEPPLGWGVKGEGIPPEPEVIPWPKLHDAALVGIVGEIVRAATQDSEADPAAVLMTVLVEAGATIGTGPHILISDTVHHARLFSVLVGASSRARKGTSVAPVQRIFEAASQHIRGNSTLPFPGGLPLRISYGPLSSGEGLVYAVRDPVEVAGKDGEIEVVDEGVEDKRLLVIEGEFSAVLRACQREGNTLSAILRTAFDHGNIEPLTKHNRIKATGAHINFIGHITEHELHCLLTSIDVWNGFANRILWAAVRRTRQVPFPQPLPDEEVSKLGDRLGALLIRAWSRGRVDLHPEAARKWEGIYGALTEDRPGALGAITSRAEALTLRLALLYSLLDTEATLIEVAHLRAAIAVWGYCNDSARYLFGEADIDPQANTIIDALAKGDKTQTEINDLFSGHLSKTQIAEILRRLQAQGRITGRQEGGGRGKGKVKTIWSLVSRVRK
jgi:hypothetical protein